MSKITNDVPLNPHWHRMLYSCTHMATVGVKGLIYWTLVSNFLFSFH